MRVFIAVLVLIFSLQSWTKAEDISDFEIEGISIGDSLLDYMSVNEIKKWLKITKNHYKYLKEPLKFKEVYLMNDPNFETYTSLSFFIKSNDKNFKIFSLRGMKYYKNDMNSCLKVRNEISKEIEKIINQYEKKERTVKSKLDKSGRSYHNNIVYDLNSGGKITISCNDWEETLRKEKNWSEGLSVVLHSAETKKWISNY